MKQYKAIFFDWDGTAVLSRKAPVDEVVSAMKGLLMKGVKLVIVSGTTYENIAGGRLEDFFTKEELGSLYLGLGRGAYNYRYEEGKPIVFKDRIPERQELIRIHDVAYEIHRELLHDYGLLTEVIFLRPNYCKIDLMVERDRGEQLFMQENEPELLRKNLAAHGIQGGLRGMNALAVRAGEKYGVQVKATCDAKYLEVGISDKSDNVDAILQELEQHFGIRCEECCFWGDEFVGPEDGIFGSDSFMITDRTKKGDFFDVSSSKGVRPEAVVQVGGGVERFLDFLWEQQK